MTPLQKAAKDIVECWDSPSWKDQPQASPDLLEALQNLLNSICDPEFGGEIDRKLACIDARTAIKAAQGEKP